jgi:hypothetical protein
MAKNEAEGYSEDKTVSRRDAALLRALSTPHKRQKEMKIGRKGRQVGASTKNPMGDGPNK